MQKEKNDYRMWTSESNICPGTITRNSSFIWANLKPGRSCKALQPGRQNNNYPQHEKRNKKATVITTIWMTAEL